MRFAYPIAARLCKRLDLKRHPPCVNTSPRRTCALRTARSVPSVAYPQGCVRTMGPRYLWPRRLSRFIIHLKSKGDKATLSDDSSINGGGGKLLQASSLGHDFDLMLRPTAFNPRSPGALISIDTRTGYLINPIFERFFPHIVASGAYSKRSIHRPACGPITRNSTGLQ